MFYLFIPYHGTESRLPEAYAELTAARAAADEMGARSVPLDALFHKLRNGAPLSDLVVTRDGTHPLAPIHEDIAKAIVKAWNM